MSDLDNLAGLETVKGHAHGWVRGLVRVPCNNRLMHIETRLRPDPPEWQHPALAAHLMKCPECWNRQANRSARGISYLAAYLAAYLALD